MDQRRAADQEEEKNDGLGTMEKSGSGSTKHVARREMRDERVGVNTCV